MQLTRIEFVNVASVEDFYDQLEGQLELEQPLTRSPDAIYDVLSTEIDGQLEVIWHDCGFSRVAMGDWYVRLLDVLNILASERADFNLSLD